MKDNTMGIDGETVTVGVREQQAALRAQSFGLAAPSTGKIVPEMLIAGLNATYTLATRSAIPAQWGRFAPSLGKVPGQIGTTSYGVCWNTKPDFSFDYLTGVQVSQVTGLPAGFTRVKLSPQRYVVVSHSKHISELVNTLESIWTKWLPDSGLKTVAAPCFESYTKDFNPETGFGGTEIRIPVQS